MKKSDIKPNTIYRVRGSERFGTTPWGFDKFVLTGDEIVGVAYDGPNSYRYDNSVKRYVEVYSIKWNRDAGQYVADADTKQIALKDIDGDYGEQGTLDDISAEQRDRLTRDNQRFLDETAQREVDKTRWAKIDTATFDLLNVREWDRPGRENKYGAAALGEGTVEVRLSLDAIEAIKALLATQAVAA